MKPSTLLFLLLPPLFWAGNIVLGRAMVDQVPPLALSFWRWMIAFLLILPFAWRGIIDARAEIAARWRDLLLMGVIGIGVYNSFQYLALQTSTALNVALIVASGPVFALLTGALFFHAPVSLRQATGALLSIIGVLWVVARGSLQTVLDLHLTPGDGYVLFAIAVWSVYTWLLRTRRPQIPTTPFITTQIGIGTLAILPFYLAEMTWTTIDVRLDQPVILTMAYIGLFPSLIAYFCWDRAVAHSGATLPQYFVNLTPVFAAVLAWVFLHETVAIYHLLGAALIFAGIVVANRGSYNVKQAVR